ncbi:hypothetical protein VKT23_012999 [Stygiomarasmius scandens]|uniref:Uncharacterized protein n=1 Tax=Marasmiellus scandens TaxID=2682957 RepID=A0ABR1J9M5_9AGAR
MAASIGTLGALKHLLQKYRPNINLANKAAQETPLIFACRSGQFDCAVHLLECGASANGDEYAMETPLSWLSSFSSEDQMMDIGTRLISAGAALHFIPRRTGLFFRMLPRHLLWSDFEELMSLQMSPLMRAVMMDSIPEVRTLLALGADPMEGFETKPSVCPTVLAAVLSLPDILQVLLRHVDRTNPSFRFYSELEVIEMALDTKATIYDPFSFCSRIIRHGEAFTKNLEATLQILHQRNRRLFVDVGYPPRERDATLSETLISRLVSLGREDIVSIILSMGYSVAGRPDSCPIVEAMKLNHESLFRLLIHHGAQVSVTVKDDGQNLTLLQILAKYRIASRPGIYIAKYLIDAGVPIDPPKDESVPRYGVLTHSAFAFAVRNQDFEMADLLFHSGADIEYAYRVNHEFIPNATIFADLMCHPTEKNLDSLTYLLQLRKPDLPDEPLPAFIVSTWMKWSVLHYAARDTVISDVEKDVLRKMVRIILSYPKYSRQVDFQLETTFITPLYRACLYANLEVVGELVEAGANRDLADFNGETPVRLLENILESYPDNIPARVQHVFGEDRASRAMALKRYKLCLETLRSGIGG